MQRPQAQTVTLDDIIITRELQMRSPRAPNWQAQAEGMQLLAQQMARDSEYLMQTLVDLALSLCKAGTAGLSLLETTSEGEEIFRWTVLAGTLAHHVGGSTPRNYSSCGVCLEQGSPVLFSHPERYFTYFQEANIPIVERLVLPLVADRHVFGTIWIISQDEPRHFDLEDVRVMTSLADFTATALLLQQRQKRELLVANAALEAEARSRALISNLPGGAAFVVDQNLRYMLAEGEALETAGFKPEDFVGHTIFEVLSSELVASYEPMYRQALAGKPFEYEHSSHDRTYISRGTPIRAENGEIYGALAVSYDITERKRTEATLRENEEKYRALFVSMDEAYAVVEVLADDNGQWNDFLFLEVNPAFVKQTGMEYPVGRKATELLGTPNPKWAQVYGRVAETGEPIRFEESEATLNRVFDLYVFRLGPDGSRRVAVLFTDISDHKRREANAAFLAEIAQDFSRLSSADEIMRAVGAKVGAYLNISNCLFAEINERQNQASIEYTWHTSDTPDVTGVYRLSEFITEEFRQAARSGETIIIRDTQTDPRTDSDRYAALKIHAYVTVPFHREGEWKYLFTVNDSVARNWREDEIELIREVTNRTFPRLERAYAEQALRESEAKYRSLFNSIDEGFCIFEMLYNDAGEAIDFRYIETNLGFERQSGRRPQPGQTMQELFPEAEDMWLKDYAEVARTGQPKRFIDFHEDLDRWFDVFVFPTSNNKNQLAALFSDVTDEKRSEAALRESQERLQKALSIETVGVLFFMLDGQITDANDTFLRMSGYNRDEARHIAHWKDLTPPEFWDVTSAAAEELATLGKTAPYEKQHIRKDGSRWWGLFSPTRLKGSGRNAECVEFVIDISDRKRAEETLRESKERQAFLLQLSDAIRPLTDPVEIMATVSETVRHYYKVARCGYSEVSPPYDHLVVARDCTNGIMQNLQGAWPLVSFGDDLIRQYRSGQTVVVEDAFEDARSKGKEADLESAGNIRSSISVQLIKQGNWVASFYVQDTVRRSWTGNEVNLMEEIAERTWSALERARTEAALRESEEKYRSLFESINDGFALLEVLYDDDDKPLDCRFLEVSPSFETQTGLTQVQGKTLRELIPSVESGWFEHYHQALVTNALVHFEMWQDYLKTWFEVDVFPYGNPQDRKVTIVFQNINEHKQAEAERLQLIQEQAAREQERQRAETLAELDRVKTLFFSNVSHEFRTPLTLSLAPLQDILSDPTHPLDPVQGERLELVHRNNLRLLKLVNTLLDFSRIEAGRIEAVYEPTDLAMFTTELTSVFRSAIERADLQLIVDCPPLPEPVFVDRQMWEKIVLNLLSNAFKFTFKGEIRVSLANNNDNCAILQIQDTGTGIAPEHLPHLFERFYQVRGIQARTHEGSGIGLALVYELVRLHSGSIEVNSTLGEGTCFTISLPFGTEHLPSDRLLDESDDQPVRPLASTTIDSVAYRLEAERWLPKDTNEEQDLECSQEVSLTPSSFLVLLVDDNADMRKYLTRILSEHFQVEAVADGKTALAVAIEQVPDLILSDVMMPRLDGVELLQALRSDPRTKEVPFILLSARAGEESIIKGLEAGADDYLIKPFSAQELVSRVNAHLQMAKLRGEALDHERMISRRKDELLSTVSHELNTPLVAILGWTRLLRGTPPSQPMLTKALETIERNAALQAKLIQDLLDISRINADKLLLSLEPVEIGSLIDIAISTVAPLASTKGIDLIWHKTNEDGDASSVVVKGDPERLVQVMGNLLTNAIKFTPPSGRVSVELSVMRDDNFADGGYAKISVIDTGIGIAAEFLPYVFERFRQGEGTNGVKGLGLGLAISRHLIQLHQGSIYVQSQGIGKGATFVIELPINQK
ncbi:ATP-binding protein [Gloeothece verrucosa]|uniref:histidine kinase n=1 Tax=Gloeothece verrucosa (strain PCC 7822) TaxID=497965 RepID=E0UKJ8_GLOV7|nr:ATP-binding protein [Gloeothece verrucosa]ADN17478.1 multi-sensor signal transduction histidine kinase [Gloeothece verrucosa PCC 7822]